VRSCAALEGLALFYRVTLGIEQLLGKKIERLHVVGGGSVTCYNQLRQRFRFPSSPARVNAALGNLLVQAIAQGHLPSLAAALSGAIRSTTTVKRND
jgi:sugar (pentulose or hexulose) kinase